MKSMALRVLTYRAPQVSIAVIKRGCLSSRTKVEACMIGMFVRYAEKKSDTMRQDVRTGRHREQLSTYNM